MSESTNTPTGNPIEVAASLLKEADKPIEASQATSAEPSEKGDPSPAKDPQQEIQDLRAALRSANEEAKKHRLRLKEFEESNLSDLERAQRQAQEAQEAAAKASLEAMRYRIAAEHGITEKADLILTAPDEATMRQQAALWAERGAQGTTTAPRPDLTQGAQSAPGLNSDVLTEALARAVGAR